jgi:hypothetical protein
MTIVNCKEGVLGDGTKVVNDAVSILIGFVGIFAVGDKTFLFVGLV